MPPESENTVYEQAKEAARAAIQSQLSAWGIRKETPLWNHLSINAYQPISMDLKLDADFGGTFEVRTRKKNAAVNPAPHLQQILVAPLDEMQDIASTLDSITYGTNPTVNLNAYSLERPLLDSLRRLGANAALSVINTHYQITSQKMAM